MNLRTFLKVRFGKKTAAINTSVGVLAGVILLAVAGFVISPPEGSATVPPHEKAPAAPPRPLLPLTAPPPDSELKAVATPVRPRNASATAPRFAWPTPLPVAADTPWEKIAQAAASGDPATGLFGLHRNGGSKFHEGLDIRAAARNRRGEPTDKVCAVIPGVVVHFTNAPNGPYGCYVVLWHGESGLRFYTLYAHMSTVSPNLKRGNIVNTGHELGIMGRSENGRMFPKERAHLHFEVGLRLNASFGNWYAKQRDFTTPNLHGAWNGINLVGMDSLLFLQRGLATGEIPSVLAQLKQEPIAFSVFITTNRVPNFVRENPALLTASISPALSGWKIDFAWHGVPLRWTPLFGPPSKGVGGMRNFLVQPGADAALMRKATLRGMLGKRQRNGTIAPGKNIMQTIGILFE